MYSSLHQNPQKLHCLTTVTLLQCFILANQTPFSGLGHLLSTSLSSFSLYQKRTPSVSFLPPSSTPLWFFYLRFCACVRFLSVYILQKWRRYRPSQLLFALYHELSLNSCGEYSAFEMERASYRSWIPLLLRETLATLGMNGSIFLSYVLNISFSHRCFSGFTELYHWFNLNLYRFTVIKPYFEIWKYAKMEYLAKLSDLTVPNLLSLVACTAEPKICELQMFPGTSSSSNLLCTSVVIKNNKHSALLHVLLCISTSYFAKFELFSGASGTRMDLKSFINSHITANK